MGGDDKEGKKKGPIISSVCPGWICYAEKTNGDLIIPHLSRVRSPQQIMGAILKEHYVKSSSDSRSKSDVYHVTLMPCFDKKLEASRDQFKQVGEDGNEIKDVDCVLTPLEFEEMLIEKNIKFFDLASRQLDLLIKTDLGFDTALTSHFGSGSGGYAENIMLAEASELLDENETVLSSSLEYSILKNSDFIELTLRKLNEQTNADDYTRKFAIVNGFRNIQTVVQRMKRNALKYDYIEIMACPSGCLNGGAQCKSNAGEDRAETIQATKKLYENIPRVELGFKSKVLKEKISSSLRLDNKSELDEMLYTTFNAVPKMQNLTVNWWFKFCDNKDTHYFVAKINFVKRSARANTLKTPVWIE